MNLNTKICSLISVDEIHIIIPIALEVHANTNSERTQYLCKIYICANFPKFAVYNQIKNINMK